MHRHCLAGRVPVRHPSGPAVHRAASHARRLGGCAWSSSSSSACGSRQRGKEATRAHVADPPASPPPTRALPETRAAVQAQQLRRPRFLDVSSATWNLLQAGQTWHLGEVRSRLRCRVYCIFTAAAAGRPSSCSRCTCCCLQRSPPAPQHAAACAKQRPRRTTALSRAGHVTHAARVGAGRRVLPEPSRAYACAWRRRGAEGGRTAALRGCNA
jgi:hypothetical protein